jgi:hypothetical protein
MNRFRGRNIKKVEVIVITRIEADRRRVRLLSYTLG